MNVLEHLYCCLWELPTVVRNDLSCLPTHEVHLTLALATRATSQLRNSPFTWLCCEPTSSMQVVPCPSCCDLLCSPAIHRDASQVTTSHKRWGILSTEAFISKEYTVTCLKRVKSESSKRSHIAPHHCSLAQSIDGSNGTATHLVGKN